jgi:outer membrane lipoprotein LolB
MKPLYAILLSLFCISCAAPLPRPPAADLERLWQGYAAALVPLSHWELRGRMAVRTNEHGGQAALTWQRDAARHNIRLNGPFGHGAVRVTQDENGARLQDAEQRVYEAASAEELLFLYTGWQLPIASLDWWVRGLPVPQLAASRDLDDAGHLRILRQQGWDVRYGKYVRVEGYELPTHVTLKRGPSVAGPAMEVRLVIDRWAQVK